MAETGKTILVVDDDPGVREVVTDCLTNSGYHVIISGDGSTAVTAMKENDIDLAIVDLGLPDVDGLDLTRSLKDHSNAGVIILSGRSNTTEKIVGLEVGADDYLTKPFEPRELLARVRSVLRRSGQNATPDKTAEKSEVYSFDGWQLDVSRRELLSDDENIIDLTSGEFDLLKVFVENPNRIMTRYQILEHADSNDNPAYDRSVDIRIARLRKKIERNSKTPQWIKTVRNAGYIFTASVTRS